MLLFEEDPFIGRKGKSLIDRNNGKEKLSLSTYETKESKKLKKELREIDVKGVVTHIVFSVIVGMFLGSFYYFFRWKIIGALLLFFAGYGILGIVLVAISLFVSLSGQNF